MQKITKMYEGRETLSERIENIPSSIFLKITSIEELKGQWISGARLSPQLLGRLKRSVLITSTGASTRIEGSKLSDGDIEKMMKGMSVKKFASRDVQEVKGYYELLQNIFQSWKHLRLSENTIKHFHKELLKYTEKDKSHRGEYKKQENKVHMLDADGKSLGIIFDTVSAYLTPKKMQELVEWTIEKTEKKSYHPLLIIANFIIELLSIHPFVDGNGRLSRLLTNLLLLKAGYEYMPYVSHEKLIEDNKSDYYLALRRTQKTLGSKKEDISTWLNFFLDTVLKQSQMAVELLSKENLEKILSEKQLEVWNYVQKNDSTSTGDITRALKISRATVKKVLEVLLRLKKVERIGLGRSTRYRKI